MFEVWKGQCLQDERYNKSIRAVVTGSLCHYPPSRPPCGPQTARLHLHCQMPQSKLASVCSQTSVFLCLIFKWICWSENFFRCVGHSWVVKQPLNSRQRNHVTALPHTVLLCRYLTCYLPHTLYNPEVEVPTFIKNLKKTNLLKMFFLYCLNVYFMIRLPLFWKCILILR